MMSRIKAFLNIANEKVKQDIGLLQQMQEQYFSDHGQYFETKGAIPSVIPDKGTDCQTTKLRRFKGRRNTDTSDDVVFTPTAKDFQISIGQGVFINSAEGGYEAGAEKRAYKITVKRKLENGIIEQYSLCDGDPEVMREFGEDGQ